MDPLSTFVSIHRSLELNPGPESYGLLSYTDIVEHWTDKEQTSVGSPVWLQWREMLQA
jgi:hypothetical protein